MLQATMLIVPLPIVGAKVWRALLFPHDEHQWLMIVALTITMSVPAAIWWREATGSKRARAFAFVIFSIAALAGFLLCLVFASWIGFLLTGPFTGPMAAEATIFLLVGCSLGAIAAAFLALSPLILDATLFTDTFRRHAWKAVVLALPTAAVVALLVGLRLNNVFL